MERYGKLLRDHPEKVLALLLFAVPPSASDPVSVVVYEMAGNFDQYVEKNRQLQKSLVMAQRIREAIDEK